MKGDFQLFSQKLNLASNNSRFFNEQSLQYLHTGNAVDVGDFQSYSDSTALLSNLPFCNHLGLVKPFELVFGSWGSGRRKFTSFGARKKRMGCFTTMATKMKVSFKNFFSCRKPTMSASQFVFLGGYGFHSFSRLSRKMDFRSKSPVDPNFPKN